MFVWNAWQVFAHDHSDQRRDEHQLHGPSLTRSEAGPCSGVLIEVKVSEYLVDETAPTEARFAVFRYYGTFTKTLLTMFEAGLSKRAVQTLGVQARAFRACFKQQCWQRPALEVLGICCFLPNADRSFLQIGLLHAEF